MTDTATFVVRRRDPGRAAQEFRLLQLLAARGLPVPTPQRLDGTALVVDYVESESPPAEPAQPLARALTRIHAAGIPLEEVSFVPDQGERAAALVGPRPPAANEPVLLHGDFWPGNCLWRDGEVAAIVDWEDAATGDPVADVANCRLELLWAAGADALEEFTEAYARALPRIDLAGLAYWDLFAAWRLGPAIESWGLAPDTVSTMRQWLDDFVRRLGASTNVCSRIEPCARSTARSPAKSP
jgi:Ser/Thr protein kinase RdoA (MazF antagonist)